MQRTKSLPTKRSYDDCSRHNSAEKKWHRIIEVYFINGPFPDKNSVFRQDAITFVQLLLDVNYMEYPSRNEEVAAWNFQRPNCFHGTNVYGVDVNVAFDDKDFDDDIIFFHANDAEELNYLKSMNAKISSETIVEAIRDFRKRAANFKQIQASDKHRSSVSTDKLMRKLMESNLSDSHRKTPCKLSHSTRALHFCKVGDLLSTIFSKKNESNETYSSSLFPCEMETITEKASYFERNPSPLFTVKKTRSWFKHRLFRKIFQT